VLGIQGYPNEAYPNDGDDFSSEFAFCDGFVVYTRNAFVPFSSKTRTPRCAMSLSNENPTRYSPLVLR
jgi:hypothetical protein